MGGTACKVVPAVIELLAVGTVDTDLLFWPSCPDGHAALLQTPQKNPGTSIVLPACCYTRRSVQANI